MIGSFRDSWGHKPQFNMRKKYCNIHVLCLLLFRCGLTNSGELIAVKQIKLDTDNIKLAKEEYEKIQEEVFYILAYYHDV